LLGVVVFQSDHRCKICNLPEDLVKSIHYARLVEGKSISQVVALLNKAIDDGKISCAPFYTTNVIRHFKKHLAPDLAAAYFQREAPLAKQTYVGINHKKAAAIEDHLMAIVAPENLEMFERLRDLMDKISEHVEIVEEFLPKRKKFGADGTSEVTIPMMDGSDKNPSEFSTFSLKDAYTPYLGLVKELRVTITEVTKFLNLKSALRRFVEELLREYTRNITSAFLQEMRYLQQEIAPDDQASATLVREVSMNFATKLAEATDVIVDKFERIINASQSRQES